MNTNWVNKNSLKQQIEPQRYLLKIHHHLPQISNPILFLPHSSTPSVAPLTAHARRKPATGPSTACSGGLALFLGQFAERQRRRFLIWAVCCCEYFALLFLTGIVGGAVRPGWIAWDWCWTSWGRVREGCLGRNWGTGSVHRWGQGASQGSQKENIWTCKYYHLCPCTPPSSSLALSLFP